MHTPYLQTQEGCILCAHDGRQQQPVLQHHRMTGRCSRLFKNIIPQQAYLSPLTCNSKSTSRYLRHCSLPASGCLTTLLPPHKHHVRSNSSVDAAADVDVFPVGVCGRGQPLAPPTLKYCWNHGNCAHGSGECTHPIYRHKKDAFFAHMMGGSNNPCYNITE